MSGNCATGSRRTITAPAITKKIAMTIATIGRLMKNLDIALVSRDGAAAGTGGLAHLRRRRLGVHQRLDLHPVRDLLHSLGDDAVPGETPSSMILRSPSVLPSLTVRSDTLLSEPTTATWY